MENTKIVENLYNSFLKGDIQYILDHLTDNCEWNASGAPFISYGGTFRGKETANFFKGLAETITIENFTVNKIADIGNNEVIALGTHNGKSNATGKEFSSPWSMLWRLDNGKVVYYQNYFDTAAVVKAIS